MLSVSLHLSYIRHLIIKGAFTKCVYGSAYNYGKTIVKYQSGKFMGILFSHCYCLLTSGQVPYSLLAFTKEKVSGKLKEQ